MKQIFIDVETTGLDYDKHCIWQIAFIIEVHGVEKCRHNLKTAPIPGSNYDEKALKIGGIKAEEIRSFPDSYKTLRDFKEILKQYVEPFDKNDKMFFVGYNAQFDMRFLRSFFYRQDDKFFGSWFWYPPVDAMILAGERLKEERSEMKDFKQATVAEHLGIKVVESRLHDAMYDVELCKQIYDIVTLRQE